MKFKAILCTRRLGRKKRRLPVVQNGSQRTRVIRGRLFEYLNRMIGGAKRARRPTPSNTGPGHHLGSEQCPSQCFEIDLD